MQSVHRIVLSQTIPYKVIPQKDMYPERVVITKVCQAVSTHTYIFPSLRTAFPSFLSQEQKHTRAARHLVAAQLVEDGIERSLIALHDSMPFACLIFLYFSSCIGLGSQLFPGYSLTNVNLVK